MPVNKSKEILNSLLLDVVKIACEKDKLEGLTSKDYQKIVKDTGNKFSTKSIETWCSKIYPYEHNLNILSHFVLQSWEKKGLLTSTDEQLKELLEGINSDDIEGKAFFKKYVEIINREKESLNSTNSIQAPFIPNEINKNRYSYSGLFLLISFGIGFFVSKWYSQVFVSPILETHGEILVFEKNNSNSNKIHDIEIKSINVLALDDLTFSTNELSKLNKYNIFQGFNTLDNCSNCLPEQASFERINQVFETPDAQPHFSTEERKKILLSDEFSQLKKLGTNLPIFVFPKDRQYSVVILKIICSIKNDGKIKIAHNAGDAIYDAIAKTSGGKDIIIPIDKEGNSITLLLFEGEELIFETKNFHWNLKVKKLFNSLGVRSSNDATLISWGIEKI